MSGPSAWKPYPLELCPSCGRRPAPREIWWAELPYAREAGSKVRPCLVLRAAGCIVDVLKITSRDKRHRADHVRIPARAWDSRATHHSWLDISRAYRIDTTALQCPAGACDRRVWREVCRHHLVDRSL